MKGKKSTNTGQGSSRPPPGTTSGDQQERALREFARVLGQLIGQRWLRQQAERGDTSEASPATRKRRTASLGKLDGESE